MKRGPYCTYNGRFSKIQKIPRSTEASRKAKEKEKNAEENTQNHTDEDVKENIDNIYQNLPSWDSNLIDDISFDQSLCSMQLNNASNISIANEFNYIGYTEQTKNKDESKKRKQVFVNPICACKKTNVGDALLMCLKIAVRHSLTWVAIIDMLRMINCIVDTEILPNSKYKLRKTMYGITADALSYHIYCSQCKKYIEKKNTKKNLKKVKCSCGFDVDCTDSFFVEIDIQDQLALLLSDDEIRNALQYRFNRKKNDDNLEDIYDGQVYKGFVKKQKFDKWDMTYTLNTDGCQAADASKITVWPIYIMINELPPDLRKKNMILIGLWVAKTEPDMVMYLHPFVTQANKLSSKGITWILEGQDIVSRLIPLGCCVDSVARPAMLHMKLFNGINGCTYCEQETEPVNGVRKYTIQEEIPNMRTDESIKLQMEQAYERDGDVLGVWGPSPLMNLKYFDLVDGMVIDFMHACLLGVTKLHTSILLSDVKEEYYIGSPNQLKIINDRLLSISPPTCVGKVPRSLHDMNIWKASEWLLWLIFYSFLCFKDILPSKYYNHFAMFVTAMNIYLEESISPSMIERARKLLVSYVINFQKLFGKKYMNYNIHLLLHISDTVENWGPLWANNTFPFESENQQLLKMKKSNYKIAEQIIYRMLLHEKVTILEKEDCISDKTKTFCDSLKKNQLKIFERIENDCILIGRGKISLLTEQETECIQDLINVHTIIECQRFHRIIFEGIRYTTLSYKKNRKCSDYFVQTKDNQFGVISSIVKVWYSDRIVVIAFLNVVRTFKRSLISDKNVNLQHIKQLKNNVKLTACPVKMLKRPCVFSQIDNKFFIGTISKGCLSTNH